MIAKVHINVSYCIVSNRKTKARIKDKIKSRANFFLNAVG
jgi:hypothetical protein